MFLPAFANVPLNLPFVHGAVFFPVRKINNKSQQEPNPAGNPRE